MINKAIAKMLMFLIDIIYHFLSLFQSKTMSYFETKNVYLFEIINKNVNISYELKIS